MVFDSGADGSCHTKMLPQPFPRSLHAACGLRGEDTMLREREKEIERGDGTGKRKSVCLNVWKNANGRRISAFGVSRLTSSWCIIYSDEGVASVLAGQAGGQGWRSESRGVRVKLPAWILITIRVFDWLMRDEQPAVQSLNDFKALRHSTSDP